MIDKLNLHQIIIYIIIIIFFSIVLIWLGIYFYKNIFFIKELEDNQIEQMEQIEKKYGKKYPLGDDYFKIIHYPKYESFFKQFKDYKYLVKKDHNNNIISTCCFAKFYNNIYYMCDLKKIDSKPNQTFDYIAYAYLILGISNIFGVVMEPNHTINHLINKYGFIKQTQLNLFKVKYSVIKKNFQLFNEIYPDFFIVPGYKKFILESDKSEIKCYHIAQQTDINLIFQLQKPVPFNDILESDDIMFCLGSKSKTNNLLGMKDIFPINIMSIITNKQIDKSELNFDLLKTYQI